MLFQRIYVLQNHHQTVTIPSNHIPSSTLIIYKRLVVFGLRLHINEALAFKQRLEGKQWTCVSSQIRILTNYPLLCM